MDVSGYSLATLHADGEFALYRGSADATSTQHPRSVLVSMPTSDHPSPETVRMLEHEWAFRSDLDSAWAVRPVALGHYQGRAALILEDPLGQPLDRLLETSHRGGAPGGRPSAAPALELGPFLQLAIGVTVALGEVHRRGIIHKNVKPAHILVNPSNGQVRLTGFGIASRLQRERQAPGPPETIAGTLAYMAPEQTGRMNRSIDTRSDLYALGVVLYERLTGALPFVASDPMEWVHCHIAKRPVPPAERSADVPVPVSEIVTKLLAKSAEERYQTAAAAEKDLRRCLVEWEARHRIEPFALGESDVPSQLVIPETLYGREAEVAALVAAFDRVIDSGTSELVLVSGYSGIGKSTVVHELHRVLVPPRGLFASGKFDQYRRDIPYATFAQAFRQLVDHVLGQSDAEIAEWRRRITQPLAGHGKLVLDLIPELELVIGPQPDVVELPPQEARTRFQRTLLRFAGVFASPEHPLVLFMDDLQWLDAASLDLLVELATDDSIGHLLVLGAYRDNEVGPGHALLAALEAIRARGARVSEIALAALQLADVTALLGDAFHADEERVLPLAALVHDKTGGNPFFVIQFVSALADDGLVSFDPAALTWVWDIERIHGSAFTENVVHLMIDRLSRLAAPTRAALSILACVGHSASLATLGAALELSDDELHAGLWPAVRSGVIFRHQASYAFLHDRVQEAAYALLAFDARPATHLMIGRRLLAHWDGVPDDKMFEIAGQFNRGAALIADLEERLRIAELDLAAARRAKASGAYATAVDYLTCASQLLPADAWESRYALARDICFERASCSLLGASFGAAEALIVEMRERSTSNVDRSRAYRLHIELAVLKSEFPRAVERALECLRLFGIAMSAHPSPDEVEAAYALVWEKLGERPIQSLIDLPRSSDDDFEAAMAVLGELYVPAIFTDAGLLQVHLCHMVALTLDRGVTAPATNAFGWFGVMLGAAFDRCQEGLHFGTLARELVARHGFAAFECKTLFSLELVSLWTCPLDDALDAISACRARGLESGDISVACAAHNHIVSDRLARGDVLDSIWPDTERGVDFARRAGFRDVVDLIVAQQRFIRCMQGRTESVATFGDSGFDEATFEAALTPDRMVTMIFWYWVLKGQARFIAGEHGEAARAFDRARPMIAASPMHIQNLDFHYFDALNLAALERLTPEERERIEQHHAQLGRWVESYPPTFADKERLIAAELARLDGADLEAMRLYDDAIRLARQNGFTQNEAIASEVCARFYANRGFERIAFTYRENARAAYERWGAVGKVRQLEAWYPNLRTPAASDSATIRTSVEHLDLATVIKVASAVTTETVLDRLIESLMHTAIAHAGADRGVLFHVAESGVAAEAEATMRGDAVVVELRDGLVPSPPVPESIVRYVARTHESVLIDDAAVDERFAADRYFQERTARSVLCLPLVKQGKLAGILYLENSLAPRVFSPARTTLLKLLASQAAISLENSRLYGDLADREARIRRLVDANIVGIFIWELDGRILEANDAFLTIVQYAREELAAGHLRWTDLTPPEWRDRDEGLMPELAASGTLQPFEKEYFRKDGSRVPVLIGIAAFDDRNTRGVAFVLDLSERKRAEEAVNRARAELAHVSRVTALSALSASITHEINQPLSGIITNADTCLMMLDGSPPNIDGARETVKRLLRDGHRAADVIARLRTLFSKRDFTLESLDVNETVREIVTLSSSELQRHDIVLHMELADDLPPLNGDRVQIQQVILNLIRNAFEAMADVHDRPRQLRITTACESSGHVRVRVRDAGIGLPPHPVKSLFDPFYSTKSGGMGIGLFVSRSIVEKHKGRLWAESNQDGPGATFSFSIPHVAPDHADGERLPRTSAIIASRTL